MQIIDMAVGRLVPYVRNARTNSADQIAQIAASIAEFGFTNPILVGEDDVIIAGHRGLTLPPLLPGTRFSDLDTFPSARAPWNGTPARSPYFELPAHHLGVAQDPRPSSPTRPSSLKAGSLHNTGGWGSILDANLECAPRVGQIERLSIDRVVAF